MRGSRQNFHVSQLKREQVLLEKNLSELQQLSRRIQFDMIGLMKVDLPSSMGSSVTVSSFVKVRKQFFFHWKESSSGLVRESSFVAPESLYETAFFSVEDAIAVMSASLSNINSGSNDKIESDGVRF